MTTSVLPYGHICRLDYTFWPLKFVLNLNLKSLLAQVKRACKYIYTWFSSTLFSGDRSCWVGRIMYAVFTFLKRILCDARYICRSGKIFGEDGRIYIFARSFNLDEFDGCQYIDTPFLRSKNINGSTKLEEKSHRKCPKKDTLVVMSHKRSQSKGKNPCKMEVSAMGHLLAMAIWIFGAIVFCIILLDLFRSWMRP